LFLVHKPLNPLLKITLLSFLYLYSKSELQIITKLHYNNYDRDYNHTATTVPEFIKNNYSI
ncbi:MAG: hypothetical protein AAB256_01330, partial [Deltaproteobacteria bacterium]